MKRLGIIGGMGPLATIDLYSKIVALTPAKCDQEHIPVIIDSYPQIEDRTKFILGGTQNPLPKLVESAKRLKNAGCDTLIMPCNTAHFFAKEIEKEAEVKILYITKIAVEALKNKYPNAKNIAVIATSGTKKARVYDEILEENHLNSVKLSQIQQEAIMDCIYKGVKAGKTSQYVELFNKTLRDIKADVYIAACTEIPMFLDTLDRDYKFIDATFELAKFALDYSLKN